MARLLADENIHPSLVQHLGAVGHDVRTVAERGLTAALDETILETATREGRILLTADKDFGLILESGPLAARGRVLLLRYQVLNWNRIAKEVSAVLVEVAERYEDDPKLLVVLSEGQYRLRHAAGGQR